LSDANRIVDFSYNGSGVALTAQTVFVSYDATGFGSTVTKLSDNDTQKSYVSSFTGVGITNLTKEANPPKIPRQKQSKTNTENKENLAKTSQNIKKETEKSSKNSTKQVLITSNVSNAVNTVNTNDLADKTDLSTSRTETKRSKRSIETIYENQELDTSAIVNSTVTLADNPDISVSTVEYSENRTPIKQIGSDATFIINKKQKLNTEANNESLTRPDSPPLPATSSEFSSRRSKKPISYREIPVNAKMRCDKSESVIVNKKK
jgi:hypothetical protein